MQKTKTNAIVSFSSLQVPNHSVEWEGAQQGPRGLPQQALGLCERGSGWALGPAAWVQIPTPHLSVETSGTSLSLCTCVSSCIKREQEETSTTGQARGLNESLHLTAVDHLWYTVRAN